MRLVASAARLAGAVVLMVPLTAHAADLDEPDWRYQPRAESPYDDPRYRELYGDDDPPPRRYTEPRPLPPSYKDERRDDRYLAPLPPPRFSEVPRYHPACLGRREVRQRLAASGWSGFHDVEMRSERIALVKAYRPSGRLFDLEVDRCTGEVLMARQIGAPEQRPYAWRGPRVYEPGY